MVTPEGKGNIFNVAMPHKPTFMFLDLSRRTPTYTQSIFQQPVFQVNLGKPLPICGIIPAFYTVQDVGNGTSDSRNSLKPVPIKSPPAT